MFFLKATFVLLNLISRGFSYSHDSFFSSGIHPGSPGDSLQIDLIEKAYQRGDTINFELDIPSRSEVADVSTVNLLVQDIHSARRWKYRYPLINGVLRGSFIVGNKIPDGIYLFRFDIQNDFFEVDGHVNNANDRDTALNFTLMTKSLGLYKNQVPLDEDHDFSLRGLLFPDTALIVFSGLRRKTKIPEILFSTSLDSSYQSVASSTRFIKVSSEVSVLTAEDTARAVLNTMIKPDSIYKINLPEVVVSATRKSLVDQYTEKYVSGLFRGDDAVIIDGLSQMLPGGSNGIFNLISSKVPGLTQVRDEMGVEFFKWRNHTTEVYIDEVKSDPETLSNLNIEDIAMIKIFRPGMQVSFGSADGGTIAVYTKMGYFSSSGKPSNSLHCLGYSPLENIWN